MLVFCLRRDRAPRNPRPCEHDAAHGTQSDRHGLGREQHLRRISQRLAPTDDAALDGGRLRDHGVHRLVCERQPQNDRHRRRQDGDDRSGDLHPIPTGSHISQVIRHHEE